MSTKRANLEDVLRTWAKGDQETINVITELGVPLGLRVDYAFEDGKSLEVVEKLVDKSLEKIVDKSLESLKRGIFLSFIVQCCKWSTPGFVRPTDLQKFDSSVSPSSYAASEWTTKQKNDKYQIMHLRPCGCSWINIRIMHPALNAVAETFFSSGGTPEDCDYILAQQLIIVMAGHYEHENNRRDAVNDVLIKYLLLPIGIHGFGAKQIGIYETDGSALESGITIEYMNEKGAGKSDPYLQNVAYHGKYWTDDDSDKRGEYKKHCCPWLMIEVLGPIMGLAGAVFACKRHHAQPLSTHVPFLPFPGDKDMQLLQARLCMALRVGATALVDFYRHAASLPESDQAFFPYPHHATLDGSADPVKFEYTNVWGGIQQRKMLFVAKRLDTGAKIMVKFTDTYGKEVHEALYRAGLAPKLHGFQEEAGMFMVVMEFLENIRPWCDDDASNEAITEQLLKVQRVLEEKGFVHGDLRAPNVCIHKETKKVFILDFDWAGKAGEMRYPVILNPNVKWPSGADVRTEIRMEHDKFMIDAMLNGKKRKFEGDQDD